MREFLNENEKEELMKLTLSEHYNTRKLIRFTLPTILVMVFTSIYGVVDGFFLSNFAGKIPFAAVNFIMPFTLILSSIGFMMGTGSAALIGKTLGEGDPAKARSQMTGLFAASVLIGLLTSAGGRLLLDPVLNWMGCTPVMLPYAREYATVLLGFLPFYMMQMYFQSLFVTAARPGVSFAVTLCGGLINMVLDYLMIGVLGWGVAGAALATGLGQSAAALLSLLSFARKPKTGNPETALYFTKFRLNLQDVRLACTNGISELFSNAASSVISILYNWQLLKYAGENGVAAYGTLMYVAMIFMAISIGYTMGSSPLVSYQYGAKNQEELGSLLRKSLGILTVGAVCMFGLAEVLAEPLAQLFAGYDPELMEVTVQAFRNCSAVFLFSGIAIFGSGFFTALNNGPVSASIALIRTLVFQVGFILVFPLIWGVDGIWYSMTAAEAMAVVVTFVLLWKLRIRYGYGPNKMSLSTEIC